jgi:hypothetical protein
MYLKKEVSSWAHVEIDIIVELTGKTTTGNISILNINDFLWNFKSIISE